MGNFRIAESLKLLKEGCEGVCGHVYAANRPKHIREHLEEFIVVSLPVRITNETVGHCGMTETTYRVEIYVRDTDGQANIGWLEELTEEVSGIFPLSKDGICASKPASVTGCVEDGNGFHVNVLQGVLSTC